MNIPVEVARAQGPHGVKGAVHGIKGASHGVKGGRPRLKLTKAQRLKRRREQKRASRQSNPSKPCVERKPRKPSVRMSKDDRKYFEIWGKLPGESLTPAEYAEREPLWIAHSEGIQRAEEARQLIAARRLASPVARPAVGRNEPCPCGSGRKFKKCCGP